MTIDFHCSQCNQPLQARDEAAGKPAKCSGCGATVQIPTVENLRWPPGTRSPNAPAPHSPSPPVQPLPPPAARPIPVAPAPAVPPPAQRPPTHAPLANVAVPIPPAFDETDRGLESHAHRQPVRPSSFSTPNVTPSMAPTPISRRRRAVGVDAIVARAWEIYKANFGLVVWSWIVVQFFLGLINGAVTVGLQQAGILPMDEFPTDGDLVQTAAIYIMPIISIWFVLGILTLHVNLARDRDAAVGDVFSGGWLFPSALVVWLLYFMPHFLLSLICGRLGLTPLEYLAVIVPTEIVMFYLLWLPTALVLIDRTNHPLDAIAYGLSYVGQNIFTLLGLFIVSVCVFAVSLLACGLGLIFGMPFIVLLTAVAYTSNTPES